MSTEPHNRSFLQRLKRFYFFKRAKIKERRSDWRGLAALAMSWAKTESYDGEAWYLLGVAYGQLGDHEREVAAYKRAVEVGPFAAGAWTNLGAAYWDLRRHEDAEMAYRKALQLTPHDTKAYSGLIHCLLAQEKKAEAAGVVEQLFQLGLRSNLGYPGPIVSVQVHGILQALDPELAQAYSTRLDAIISKLTS